MFPSPGIVVSALLLFTTGMNMVEITSGALVKVAVAVGVAVEEPVLVALEDEEGEWNAKEVAVELEDEVAVEVVTGVAVKIDD